MDLSLLIGGEAGQGLKTVDYLLGKTFFRMGYHVFSSKDYMSRIRGGHNFIKLRLGDRPLTAISREIDLLLALNDETVSRHEAELKEDGWIIFDGELETEKKFLNLPARELAKGINPRGVNTVFIGAVLKMLGLKKDKAEEVIKEYFQDEKIIADNLDLLAAGYEAATEVFPLPAGPNAAKQQLYLDGNNAIALGAALAGVRFYAAYPMSPATSIMNYLAAKQEELGMVVEQAEDEIAAINMALGASYSGIRSMTGTSGGGFALMTEAVGLAGIAEIPVVIADIQRPGPATGLPTRTEQGDLLFAINAAQGDLPLMVMAPRNHEDAFYQTFRAFNLADKYQLPVIILSDQYLADAACNLAEFNLANLKIERHLISKAEAIKMKDYKRYQFTEDGISPRAYPGQLPEAVVLIDSDEHDEYGHIIEDALTRKRMVDKRAKKLKKLIAEDLQEPEYRGEAEIDYLFIGFGSSYGALLEAQELLQAEGYKVGLLSFSDVWPFPSQKLNNWGKKGVKLVVVENNFTGQFARLMRSETGWQADQLILKYDGRPFSPQEICTRFKEEVVK